MTSHDQNAAVEIRVSIGGLGTALKREEGGLQKDRDTCSLVICSSKPSIHHP